MFDIGFETSRLEKSCGVTKLYCYSLLGYQEDLIVLQSNFHELHLWFLMYIEEGLNGVPVAFTVIG